MDGETAAHSGGVGVTHGTIHGGLSGTVGPGNSLLLC